MSTRAQIGIYEKMKAVATKQIPIEVALWYEERGLLQITIIEALLGPDFEESQIYFN